LNRKEAKAYHEMCPSKPCESCPDRGICSAYVALSIYGDLPTPEPWRSQLEAVAQAEKRAEEEEG